MSNRRIAGSRGPGSYALLLGIGLLCAGHAVAAENVVVYRMGDGSAPLSIAAVPAFLDEYTPDGDLVRTIALPTAPSGGGNRALTASGTAAFGGLLTRSVNGFYLLATGFDAPPGTDDVSQTSAADVARVVGRVDAAGAIDTTTALTDQPDGENIRSAASTDGVQLWITGGAGGVRYTTLGSTSSVRLNAGTNRFIQAHVFGGQLYVSTHVNSPPIVIGTVGSGTPTTGGQTITPLPGLPTGNPGSFFLADLSGGVAGLDTLYVADDTRGVSKYSLVGGTWTENGTLGDGSDDYRGLTGEVAGGVVTLYATRNATDLERLVDDSGYDGAFSPTVFPLATSPANTAFRGVALAPRSRLRCGGRAVTIAGTGGNDTLVGTSGVDVIHGRGGHDVIRGMGGGDFLCGGPGNDTLSGGGGGDVLVGGGGSDVLAGNGGNDVLRGGGGDDDLDGGTGTDSCDGGAGSNDIVNCP